MTLRDVDHPGDNPGANRWIRQSTPIRMLPPGGSICGRLTYDFPLGCLQGGYPRSYRTSVPHVARQRHFPRHKPSTNPAPCFAAPNETRQTSRHISCWVMKTAERAIRYTDPQIFKMRFWVCEERNGGPHCTALYGGPVEDFANPRLPPGSNRRFERGPNLDEVLRLSGRTLRNFSSVEENFASPARQEQQRIAS